MTSEYIDIVGKWGVIFCYDLRMLDEYAMRSMMMSLGMRGRRIEEAVEVLLDEKNTGMCVSNDRLRMSVIFIGNPTSEEQYWDSVAHELGHAAHSICDHYGVSHTGEDFSWTLGYLMRKVVEKTAPPCK